MPTYVVVGASRGLGYEFIRQYAANPQNNVFGLVRDKASVELKAKADGIGHVHIIQADIGDRKSLEMARVEIEGHTSSIDYLINNAAYLPSLNGYISLGDLEDDPDTLEHELLSHFQVTVVGIINTIRILLPLIKRGNDRTIVTITSGMSDLDFINNCGIYEAGPYSIAKAALNTAMAKFSAQLKGEGVLCLSICPGIVDTGPKPEPPADFISRMLPVYPHFQGPISPQESVEAITKVMQHASIANGDGGQFLSHHGNKTWL